MTTIHRIPRTAVAVLAALALTFAFGATRASAAQNLTAQAGGVTVSACSEQYVLTFRLFTRAISCSKAFKLVNATASSDRWCPKGWKTRKSVKLDGRNGDKADPAVTLCTRTVKHRLQAFTYYVPTG
jgi:hypothetical protein